MSKETHWGHPAGGAPLGSDTPGNHFSLKYCFPTLRCCDGPCFTPWLLRESGGAVPGEVLSGDWRDRAGPASLPAGAPCLPEWDRNCCPEEGADSLCLSESQDWILSGEVRCSGVQKSHSLSVLTHQGICSVVSLPEDCPMKRHWAQSFPRKNTPKKGGRNPICMEKQDDHLRFQIVPSA
jgi:hypothetical protein